MAKADSVSKEHVLTTLKGLSRVLHGKTQELPLNATSYPDARPAAERVPLDSFLEFQQALCAEHKDPLLLARAYAQLNFDQSFLIKTYLAGALSIGEAIALLTRYQPVGSDLCSAHLQESPDGAAVHISRAARKAPATEALDAMVYGVARTLLAFGIREIDSIQLDHTPALEHQDHYRALFPGPLEFGAGSLTIRFASRHLSRSLPWNVCRIQKLARRERRLRQLNQTQWSESVSILIPPLFRSGEPGIDQCAGLLAVSRRSLQRHIRNEGSTFKDIIEQNRRKLAQNYLARGYSNDATATLLGYRQSAQFYRAFRAWFDTSPNEFRQQIQI